METGFEKTESTQKAPESLKTPPESLEKLTCDKFQLKPHEHISRNGIDAESARESENTTRIPIKSLKDNIKEQEGIDTDRARLVFNGKTLEWNRTLLGLGIPSRGIIHLAMFPNKNAYPPFEELTPDQREKTMQDQYLLNEHMLKRDPKYHTHMKKKYDDYQSKKKAYFDSLQEN